MAITYVQEKGFRQVIFDASSNWDSLIDLPQGIRAWYILFFPSAANDIICIRQGSATGPIILKAKDTEGKGLLLNLPGNVINPYIVRSECTFGTYGNVVLTFCET